MNSRMLKVILLLALSSAGFAAAGLLAACAPQGRPTGGPSTTLSPYPSQPGLARIATSAPPVSVQGTQTPESTPLPEIITATSEPYTPELTLEISLAKEVFRPGETISVTLVVRNVSTRPLTVTRVFDPWAAAGGDTIGCSLWRDGEYVILSPDIRFYLLGRQDLAVLGPGEERKYVIENLDWCAERSEMRPGNYRLYLKYLVWPGERERLKDAGLWTGLEYSNEVTFTIVDD